jgi:hypothetical protein
MNNLPQRFKLCVSRGSLTLADLARWFERPHTTVRTWYVLNRIPNEGYRNETFRRLHLLEEAIKKNKGSLRYYPPLVPAEIKNWERPLYLRRLYNVINDEILGVHTAE